MNTQSDNAPEQAARIMAAMDELYRRRSPAYAEALSSIIKRLPPGCDEIRQLREHQRHYLAELEAKQ